VFKCLYLYWSGENSPPYLTPNVDDVIMSDAIVKLKLNFDQK